MLVAAQLGAHQPRIPFERGLTLTWAVEAELTRNCRATVYGINFAFGSAQLDTASAPTLSAIAKAMTDHPDWRLGIVGHTDSIGTAADNLELSRRRAERVRLALTSAQRVTPARLLAEGKGESQPVDDNGSLAGRARNRRVAGSRLSVSATLT